MARIRGDLKDRSFQFAKQIVNVSDTLPNNVKGWTLAKQLIRSGTSIGANVREADNAYSDAEFTHQCNVARKEASETQYWLDLCTECGLIDSAVGVSLSGESDELTRVLSTIVKKMHEKTGKPR